MSAREIGMFFRMFAPKPLKKARRVATIAATSALFFALGGTASTAQPVASAACTRDVPAVIGGKHECLGPGEYCATRYERQYERYGFVCSISYSPPRLRRK
jgi:hypothetical protein